LLQLPWFDWIDGLIVVETFGQLIVDVMDVAAKHVAVAIDNLAGAIGYQTDEDEGCH